MEIAHMLRDSGYKVTPQRIAIYDALVARRDHPTAETIYQRVYVNHPTMSLATVYKTLEIFSQIGLVKVLDVGDDSSHYDWDTSEHPHIRCTQCNRVDDLLHVDVEAISKIASASTDYQVTGQQISFEGVCPACRCKANQ